MHRLEGVIMDSDTKWLKENPIFGIQRDIFCFQGMLQAPVPLPPGKAPVKPPGRVMLDNAELCRKWRI
jgi:hypothetical protein